MGQSDYNTCTQCIRFTFIGCNIFFLVLSIVGFSIGIWGVVVANNQDDAITGDNAVSSAAILLTSSIISFGLCAAGIVGAVFMWRLFLILYAIVLGIIVILEFISAILAFVYADRAREIVRDNFKEAIEDYRVSSDDDDYSESTNDAVEAVQDGLECCGIDDATDWITYNEQAVIDNDGVPPGDCACSSIVDDDCVAFNGTTSFVWEDGCLDILEIILRAYGVGVGVVSLLIMLVEIVFVLVAIGLTVTITKTRGKGSVI